jgi:tetratricopeptide (TPR) repeat protein/transcriptional regulator with XRE-family HTH domain
MKPKSLLKRERELRGWSQAKVAEEVGTTTLNISRWERGISLPYPHFREKLCALFGKDALALGLLEQEQEPGPLGSSMASGSVPTMLDPAIPPIPTSQTTLVGRTALLQSIKQTFGGETRPVCVALNGLPGVGKTALALHLAHDPEIGRSFPDGILWADLGPQPDVNELLSRWGALLGVSVADVEPAGRIETWARALRLAIGWRHMLLVIDDVWALEDALAVQVGGPCCAYLVTTRHPHIAVQLAADGARVVPELLEEDGLALLGRYAPTFVAQAPETARTMVRSVGALPLALTLMGKYLSVQVYSGQPRRLQAAIHHLRDSSVRLQLSEARALAERPPSLRDGVSLSLQSVIAVSEQCLEEHARQVLHMLSLFPARPNSFSEEAALMVCQTSTEALDQLADAGLLESHGPGRYMLHQTIADYARAALHDLTPMARLADYYVRFLEEHRQDYQLLTLETANILTALEILHQEQRHQELLRGVDAWSNFLLARGLFGPAEKHLQQATCAARQLQNTRSLLDMQLRLGKVKLNLGHTQQAREALLECLHIVRQEDHPDRLGAIVQALGKVESALGNYPVAEAYFREGLDMARTLGLREQVCDLLAGLGVAEGKCGNYQQAETHLNEGLQLARSLESQERTAALLIDLGWIDSERGNYLRAEAYYLECLRTARDQGHNQLVAIALIRLGILGLKQGYYAESQVHVQEARELLRQGGQHPWIGLSMAVLAEVALAQQNEEHAERYLHEGQEFARRFEHRETLGWLAISVSGLALRHGQEAEAQAAVDEALTIGYELHDVVLLCQALFIRGRLSLSRQQPEQAREAFIAIQETAPAEHQELQATALSGLALVAQARGEITLAHRLGQSSLNIFRAIGHTRVSDIARWMQTLALDIPLSGK